MAQFLTNKNQQFLNYLKQELTVCDSFAFSVSFIKHKSQRHIIIESLIRGFR